MWFDVRWRPPALKPEGLVLDEVHRLLSRAYPLDPSLGYPWRAWAEIVGLRNIADPMGRQVVARAMRESGAGPEIGYRRAPVTISHEGWALTIPGSFAEKRTAEEWWGGGAGQAITLAAVQTGTASGAMPAHAFIDQFAGEMGPTRSTTGPAAWWAVPRCRATPAPASRSGSSRATRRWSAPARRSGSSSTIRPTGSGPSTSGSRSPRAEERRRAQPWRTPFPVAAGPLPVEDPLDLDETGRQRVDVVARGVDAERGPGRGGQVEPLVERHRAVVAGPDRDAEAVEDLRHVCGWMPGRLNGITPPRSAGSIGP